MLLSDPALLDLNLRRMMQSAQALPLSPGLVRTIRRLDGADRADPAPPVRAEARLDARAQ